MEQSMADIAGILFPADENGLLKLCSCRFITNYFNSHVPGASLGHSLQKHPGDGVPRQIEEEMRSFVRDMIPELADRPWYLPECAGNAPLHQTGIHINANCPA